MFEAGAVKEGGEMSSKLEANSGSGSSDTSDLPNPEIKTIKFICKGAISNQLTTGK